MFLLVLATRLLAWTSFRPQGRGAPGATLPLLTGFGTRIPTRGGTEHSACSILWVVTAILLVALLTAFSGQKLSAQERVDLKVWDRIPTYGQFVPLKDFDTSVGARNAIAVKVNGNAQVRYLRYPGDTGRAATPVLTRYNLTPIDLNGDGVGDYIGGDMIYYRGLQNGLPPVRSSKVAQLDIQPYIISAVFDVDNDGIQDLVSTSELQGNDYAGYVLLGNRADSNWRILWLKVPEFQGRFHVGGRLYYQSPNGKLRVLGIHSNEDLMGFTLLEADSIVGGTHIEMRVLSRYERFARINPDRSKTDFWTGVGTFVYYSPSNNDVTLSARRTDDNRADIFHVVGDSLVFSHTSEDLGDWFSDLRTSVDADDVGDVVFYKSQLVNGAEQYGLEVRSGNPFKPGYKVIGWFPIEIVQDLYTGQIGDVNNDGLIDIGCAYNNQLTIFLSGSGVVSAESTRDSDLGLQVMPNPTNGGQQMRANWSNPTGVGGSLTITNVSGEHRFKALLPEGSTTFELHPDGIGLASGRYILTLDNSGQRQSIHLEVGGARP